MNGGAIELVADTTDNYSTTNVGSGSPTHQRSLNALLVRGGGSPTPASVNLRNSSAFVYLYSRSTMKYITDFDADLAEVETGVISGWQRIDYYSMDIG